MTNNGSLMIFCRAMDALQREVKVGKDVDT